MRLTSELGVDAPLERTWAALLEADPPDGAWRGILNGYAGSVHLDDVDEDEHAAGFYAQGRELRGDGLASARVTARLAADDASTRVVVETDLNLAGRATQLDRDALQQATDTLLGRLVAQLEHELAAPTPEPRAEPPAAVDPLAEGTIAAEPPAARSPAEPPAGAPPPDLPPVHLPPAGGPPPEAPGPPTARKLDLLVALDKVAERALLLVIGAFLGLLLGRSIWGRR